MATSPSVSLSGVSLIAFREGAYRFHASASPALGADEFVLVQIGGDDAPCLRLRAGLAFQAEQLAALLHTIAAQGKWAQSVPCRALRVTAGGSDSVWVTHDDLSVRPMTVTIAARSSLSMLQAPVEPMHTEFHPGVPALRLIGLSRPRIPYVWVGTPAQPIGEGRVLSPAVGRRHYFLYKNVLETNPVKRGLDCTTFVTSAFQVHDAYARPPDAFGDGSKVAACLNAYPVIFGSDGKECCATGSGLADFFKLNDQGEFILWRPGRHCMMVIKGTMLEFNVAPVWGFRETPIQTYLAQHPNAEYMLRALPWSSTALPPMASPAAGGRAGSGGGGGGGAGGSGGKTYTVVSGDSLSLITGRLWGDVLLWPILYDANRAVVGSNPNLIKPGQRLTVPDIGKYSSAQLADARRRAVQ